MSAIRDKHEVLLMADNRVHEAQTALDCAIREHWMASQARVKAEEEYYAEVKGIKERAEGVAGERMLAAANRGAALVDYAFGLKVVEDE